MKNPKNKPDVQMMQSLIRFFRPQYQNAGEKITFKFEAAHSGGSTLSTGKATRHFLLDNPRVL